MTHSVRSNCLPAVRCSSRAGIFLFAIKEHGLMVSENRMLRRIFRPKRDEVMGGWRKLQNEELNNAYSSPNIRMIKSGRMRWAVLHGVHRDVQTGSGAHSASFLSGSLSRWSIWSVKPATQSLVLMLRMNGALPSFLPYASMAWCKKHIVCIFMTYSVKAFRTCPARVPISPV
jgi:hypothetical protein